MAAIFCLFLISSSTAMYSDSLGSNFLCGFLKAYYIKKKKKSIKCKSKHSSNLFIRGFEDR